MVFVIETSLLNYYINFAFDNKTTLNQYTRIVQRDYCYVIVKNKKKIMKAIKSNLAKQSSIVNL